jgi:hypothetical protein
MSSDDTDQRTTPKRRTVLKTLGAAAAAATGAAGTASARTARAARQAQAAYASPDAARQAVADHATPLLSALADRGVLDRGDVAELGIDALQPAWEYEQFGDGATVTAVEADGTLSAKIAASGSFGGDTVELSVQPERGVSYALVHPSEGDPFTLRQEPDGTISDTASDCGYEYFCEDDHCESSIYTYYRQYCCTDDGFTYCEYAEKVGCC